MEREDLRPIIEKTGDEMKLCVDAAVECVTAFLEAYQIHGSVPGAFTEPNVHRQLVGLMLRTSFLHKCDVVKYAHIILDMLLHDLLVDDVYKEASLAFLSILQDKMTKINPFDSLAAEVYTRN